jgi:hypothetical protein
MTASPANTESIEPSDRNDLPAAVSQFQIICRPWGHGSL